MRGQVSGLIELSTAWTSFISQAVGLQRFTLDIGLGPDFKHLMCGFKDLDGRAQTMNAVMMSLKSIPY